jgi:hypothetical protein
MALDHLLNHGNGKAEDVNRDAQAGRYFLKLAGCRMTRNLDELWSNDDEGTTRTADGYLGR